MNKDRLLKLADLLEADAKNDKGIKFDLAIIAVKATPEYREADTSFQPGEVPTLDCGTAACAVGLACISGAFKDEGLGYEISSLFGLVPSYGGMACWGAEKEFFGLDHEESEFLFQDYSYGDGEVRGADGERLVAQRIRDFVAGTVKATSPALDDWE